MGDIALDSSLAPRADDCAALASDNARLRRAFVDHYAGVWRFLRRMGVPVQDAHDAAQQVFLVALGALPRIALGSERAFLYGTAIRTAIGLRRRPLREVGGVDVERAGSPLLPADELADQKRARQVLDDLLEHLEPTERAVFVLFEVDGFTVPEIAKIIGTPLGTAASRLRRGREQFQVLVRRNVHGSTVKP